MLVAFAGILPALLPALQATRVNLVASMRMESALGPRRSRLRNVFMIAQIAGVDALPDDRPALPAQLLDAGQHEPGLRNRASARPRAQALRLQLRRGAIAGALRQPRRARARAAGRRAASRSAIAFPFYVGFPKTTKVSADGTDCATTRVPGRLRLRRRPRLHGRARRAGGGRARSSARRRSRPATRHRQPEAGRASVAGPRARSASGSARGRSGRQLRVIGVAADVNHHMLGETPREYLYRPLLASEYGDTVTVIVRTSGDPAPLLSTRSGSGARPRRQPAARIGQDDGAADGDAAVAGEDRGRVPRASAARSRSSLATVGLFGLTYLTVSQRTREFGIRAALGASPRRVMGLVLREGHLADAPGRRTGTGRRRRRRPSRGQRALRRQPGRSLDLRGQRRAPGNRRAPRVPAAGVSRDQGRSDARAARGVNGRSSASSD